MRAQPKTFTFAGRKQKCITLNEVRTGVNHNYKHDAYNSSINITTIPFNNLSAKVTTLYTNAPFSVWDPIKSAVKQRLATIVTELPAPIVNENWG